jgi:alanine racemase
MAQIYGIETIASHISVHSSIAFPNEKVSYLSIDSRKLFQTDGVLFFAIDGDRHNGHQYIKTLLSKGVRNFVVSDESWLQYDDANYLLVGNVVRALQQIALLHRNQFNYPVLAITGSNGKTITKEWLAQLFIGKKNIVKSPRSFNSQVGVPLSVWQMNAKNELAIFEAGISKPGEMKRLQKVIEPTLGLFTNIGDAHGENFANLPNKIDEKAELFESCESLFYCGDHELIRSTLTKTYPEKKHISWGKDKNNTLEVTAIESDHGTIIQACYKNDNIDFQLPYRDKASIENACHCILVGLELGLETSFLQDRIAQLTPIAMRLEVKKGIHQSVIINDVYNADLGSLEIALESLDQHTQYDERTLILSDVMQTGVGSSTLIQKLNQLIEQFQIDQFIGIGPVLFELRDHIDSSKTYFFESTKECLLNLSSIHVRKHAILVKGARSFQLEKIVERLEEQVHVTRLEIDFNALANNLNYFRSLVQPTTKLMAMVKASAYGGGSVPIARQLAFHRVDYLAVAYADEGVELREAGIDLPIMVMSPESRGFDQMIQYRLEPEIFSFQHLEAFRRQLKAVSSEVQSYPVHIMFDTGMKRLGFDEQDVEALAYELKSAPELRVASVMSHLAASDEADHDTFTKRQIQRFSDMYSFFSSIIGEKPDRHILNSAGISRHPEAQFEMVRLGIGMFGIPRTNQDANQLIPVVSYRTEVVQIKEVPPGESVGYGRSEIASKRMKIATLAIGYADGLSRALGNRKSHVLIQQAEAPIVGNVCMDMCMVDVTGLDVSIGDTVEVFGKNRSLVNLAEELNTIPYEVLTSVSNRVKRVYFQE